MADKSLNKWLRLAEKNRKESLARLQNEKNEKQIAQNRTIREQRKDTIRDDYERERFFKEMRRRDH